MNKATAGKKRETIIIGRDLFKMIELKEKGWSVLWTGEGKICLVNRGKKMKTYRERKEAAREEAIEYQRKFGDQSYSWHDLAVATCYFEKIGKRYGLLKEFKENGII